VKGVALAGQQPWCQQPTSMRAPERRGGFRLRFPRSLRTMDASRFRQRGLIGLDRDDSWVSRAVMGFTERGGQRGLQRYDS
jgi:hypothetical protein